MTAGVRPGSSAAVVTIAAGRREHLRRQAMSLANQTVAPERYVIVDLGGDDPRRFVPEELQAQIVSLDEPGAPTSGATPGSLPLARARNVGAETADADVTVFLDVDCIAHPDLVRLYDEAVTTFRGVHAGPVGYLPEGHPRTIDPADLDPVARYQDGRPVPGTHLHRTRRIELFWSLSFAIDRASWARSGGFDEGYVGYGGEDTDFARRLDRVGVPIWFSGRARAFHQYHPVSSPPIEHVEAICRNAVRFRRTWGDWPMAGWLAEFAELGLVEWSPTGDRCVPTVSA